jgi:formylglycine-generating enzyme required for sulfatase activity
MARDDGSAPGRARRLRLRYELLDEHAGNGSTACAVFDHALRRELRVRFAKGLLGSDPIRVARTLARLQHPGIASCHDFGEDAELGAWLATSVTRGRSLAQLLASGGVGLLRVADILLRVAEAMTHAHQRGVAHGRLDAACVLVAEDGQVVVDGWGDAVGEGDDPCSPAAAAADVRAIGALVGACLVAVRDNRGRVRAELGAIRDAAVGDRYADARALLADFRALIDGHVVRAHATGTLAGIRKWAGRHRLLAIGLVLLAATVLATGIGYAVAKADAIRRMSAANAAWSRAEADAQRATELVQCMTEAALGLGDREALRRLLAEAESLWPAVEQNLARYDRWLAAAAALAGGLAGHRDHLQEVTRLGTPGDDAALPRSLRNARAWLRDVLGELVRDLEQFAQEERGELAAVRRRRTEAATLVERSIGGEHATAWSETIRRIATASAYRGWRGPALMPQVGLLPLGQDPDSGHFEFAHLPTGEPAARDPRTGRLVLTPASGVVLVLLPGGCFNMGAQSEDPSQPNYSADAAPQEGPVHEVVLAPFLCSKYELTRAQWARLAGGSAAEEPLLPAVGMSWEDCMRTLPRAGLRVPTEAQWEFAARGGTATPWWTGPDAASLQHSENLRDRSHDVEGTPWSDGYNFAAPVDTMLPNAFGLHHVLGNVVEFCRDSFSPYCMPVRGSEAERLPGASDRRTARGGNWVMWPKDLRTAARKGPAPTHAKDDHGVRPVRAMAAGR